jgi:hypothetical protein
MGGGWQGKYWGFEWVAPYATLDAFRAHFLVTMALGMCMTAGLAHRPVALALLVSLAYTFLLDMNNYLNHIYLMLLVQAVLCLAPANAKWALDNVLFPSTRRFELSPFFLSPHATHRVCVCVVCVVCVCVCVCVLNAETRCRSGHCVCCSG